MGMLNMKRGPKITRALAIISEMKLQLPPTVNFWLPTLTSFM
jgi:hypothetical protein